uniref:Uncharacterized protein n=1 Tax=Arundo donax TaxID=35708 RepID=A0A0A9ECD8_ARUDO
MEGKRRLGRRNYREARLFFGSPDDIISLEETVHSLEDANTLLAIYTPPACRPAGRPAPAHLAEEVKKAGTTRPRVGWDWDGVTPPRRSPPALRGGSGYAAAEASRSAPPPWF